MDDDKRPLSVGAFKAFVAKYEATQGANHEYQRKSLRWSVKTFIVVSIYTAVTTGLFLLGYCTLSEEKNNLYYSQRASIILNKITLVPLLLANVRIGYLLIPEWQNVGNTSATNLTYLFNYRFTRDPLPNGFTSVNDSKKAQGPMAIGPKETLSAGSFETENGAPGYFPQGCVDDTLHGKFRYAYVWGWAKYRDVFKTEKSRETRFCWRLFGTLQIQGIEAFNHLMCDEGNCQDETCDQYNYMKPPPLPTPETCVMSIPVGAQPKETAPQPTSPAAPSTEGGSPPK